MNEAQRDLFGRKIRNIGPSEFEIQKSLVARLRLQCRKGVLYFHCPNGEERDDRVAAKLKAMGVLPGVADLIFIWGELVSCPNLLIVPQILFLELKRRGARQTTDQILFDQTSKAAGCFYELADSIDDAVAILQRYAILPRQGDSHDRNNRTRPVPRAHDPSREVFSAQRKTRTKTETNKPKTATG